ncbi:TetR/AcrR family transcriptional regulator [Rhodopseudomonas sp. BR0M22]|uniref:TetR/AcrR family transcriptional regulator n=1 Tax=Rhodopseudomonas sp. BR0M22 TaxID=2269369 RepID=UPI0013DEEDDB|nr:TetR/AcrR family transcriptional regulator [Rhodopseudomonas sp. BR0M22]NEW92918.1 TetR/AcrR family transcriptional regulator [Rhodopseudomonas sp. BR0M22]
MQEGAGMPRVRADNYDDKYRAILDSAAALFAKVGYPSAKLQDVAKLCGATKSMLYHYFPTKDDLLLALLIDHLERLLAEIDQALTESRAPDEQLQRFIDVFVTKSAQSRQRHVSAMNDAKFLPTEKRAQVLRLERKVRRTLGGLLRDVNPGLPDEVYAPYAMLLIGMLNWTDLWYRPAGKMKPRELCDRIARLYLGGFLAETSEGRSPEDEGRAPRGHKARAHKLSRT